MLKMKKTNYKSIEDYFMAKWRTWRRATYIMWGCWIIGALAHFTCVLALGGGLWVNLSSLFMWLLLLASEACFVRMYHWDVTYTDMHLYEDFIAGEGHHTYDYAMVNFMNIGEFGGQKMYKRTNFAKFLKGIRRMRRMYGRYYLDRKTYWYAVRNEFFADVVINTCLTVDKNRQKANEEAAEKQAEGLTKKVKKFVPKVHVPNKSLKKYTKKN